MKLYAHNHLKRIGLDVWACQNLKRIYHYNYFSNADSYYQPTDEFEQMVQQHNVLAALKGIHIIKPVYKSVYKSRQHNDNRLVWGA